MQLVDLPIELLQKIIVETIPNDFENFVLSCKYIYSLAEHLFQRHNLYKRKYYHICLCPLSPELEPGRPEYNALHPLQLLHDLRKDNLLVRYIRQVSLNNSKANSDLATRRTQELCEQMGTFFSFSSDIFESPYLRAAGEDLEEWKTEIMHGSMVHATTLLLSQLPYLEALRPISGLDRGTFSRYTRIFENLLPIIVRGEPTLGLPSALPLLKTLLPGIWLASSAFNNMNAINPYLLAPNLTRWIGSHLTANMDGREFYWPYRGESSNIECLTMLRSCMVGRTVHNFFLRFPNLKQLIWEHDHRPSNNDDPWDSQAFVHALSESPCVDTLEGLTLSFSRWHEDIDGATIKSFRKFTSLQRLSVHVRCLTGISFSIDTIGRRNRHAQSSQHDILEDDIRLCDLLPESLEELTLLTTSGKHWFLQTKLRTAGYLSVVARLVLGISQERPTKLPSLRSITLVTHQHVWAHADPEEIFRDSPFKYDGSLTTIERELDLASIEFKRKSSKTTSAESLNMRNLFDENDGSMYYYEDESDDSDAEMGFGWFD